MELVEIKKEDSNFDLFLKKANEAYLARSNEKIPVVPILAKDIMDNEQIFVVMEEGEIVSGCCLYSRTEKIVRLQHVWTDVKKPRRGYASFLVDQIESVVKSQGNLELRLGVMSAYKPAYLLYKKKGYKEYAILANKPKTCYTISMVKYLGNKGRVLFRVKRTWKFFYSKIKFFLLFKKDSSPKWLYHILYKKGE